MPKQEFKLTDDVDWDELRERERENAERRELRKAKDQRRRDMEDFVGQASRPAGRAK